MPFDIRPQLIVAFLALGMALAFVVADRNSPTSRALALFLAFVGISIGVAVLIALPYMVRYGIPWWGGVFALPETLAFIFAFEWILRVRRTVPTRNLKTRFADRQLRVARISTSVATSSASNCAAKSISFACSISRPVSDEISQASPRGLHSIT